MIIITIPYQILLQGQRKKEAAIGKGLNEKTDQLWTVAEKKGNETCGIQWMAIFPEILNNLPEEQKLTIKS